MIGYSDTVVGFKRLSKRPLEYNSVFPTKEDALNYVNEDPTAYDGQMITVSEEGKESVYMLVIDRDVLKLSLVANVGNESYYDLNNVLDTITINHNMNKLPSIKILDNDSNVIYVDILYVDSNNITLSWNGRLSGRVYLT